MTADRIIFWFENMRYPEVQLSYADRYVGGKRYYAIRRGSKETTYTLRLVTGLRAEQIVASGFTTVDEAKDFAEVDYIIRQFS